MSTGNGMDNELTVLGACPLDCPDTCGWSVTVRDGRAVALRGDPNHPSVDERDADMAGGAVYHDNRVEITAAPR